MLIIEHDGQKFLIKSRPRNLSIKVGTLSEVKAVVGHYYHQTGHPCAKNCPVCSQISTGA